MVGIFFRLSRLFRFCSSGASGDLIWTCSATVVRSWSWCLYSWISARSRIVFSWLCRRGWVIVGIVFVSGVWSVMVGLIFVVGNSFLSIFVLSVGTIGLSYLSVITGIIVRVVVRFIWSEFLVSFFFFIRLWLISIVCGV